MAAIETGGPALAMARGLLERFHGMLRARDTNALAPWLADTDGSLIASFGKGIRADFAAVRAALCEPWPNGQTEATGFFVSLSAPGRIDGAVVLAAVKASRCAVAFGQP